MPTKRHQETLAVSGDGTSFAELKHNPQGATAHPEAAGQVEIAEHKAVVQHDRELDRSETGDPLKRAVERAKDKRNQG